MKVEEIRAGILKFIGSDTTILSAMVSGIFAENPKATAYCLPKFDEASVLVCADKEEARRSLVRLREVIQSSPVIERTREDCVWATCSDPREANLWRRALMTRVSTAAIVECEVLENSSAVASEIVAHRLGQVALRCSRPLVDELRGSLEARSRIVFARDLKLPEGVSVAESDADSVLLRLSGKQAFSCRVLVRVGTTLDSGHSRNTAVAGVEYWPVYAAHGPAERLLTLTRALADHKNVSVRSEADALILCGSRHEFLEDLAGADVRIEPTGQVRLVWESRGHMSALECLQSARSALLRECEELCVVFS